MNLLHTKIRNRLTPERVDKLLYIQFNRRTLRRDQKVHVLEEEDDGFITEEEPEEAIFDTAEVQVISENVEIIPVDEFQMWDRYIGA